MKKTFIVSGSIAVGYSLYKLGKIVGMFKGAKIVVDRVDEVLPGVKEGFDRGFRNIFIKDEGKE